MLIEDGADYCAEKMCILLKYMAESIIITPDQIKMVCVETQLILLHTLHTDSIDLCLLHFRGFYVSSMT